MLIVSIHSGDKLKDALRNLRLRITQPLLYIFNGVHSVRSFHAVVHLHFDSAVWQ